MKNKGWYDDFLNEIQNMEATKKCPKCKSNNIYHVDPFSYAFMCGHCGHTWKATKGKYIQLMRKKFGHRKVGSDEE